MTRFLKRSLYVICLTSSLAISSYFASVPVAQAAIINREWEIDIGRGVAKQVEQQYGLVNDAALQARVAQIGAKLAAVSDRADMPYTFKVLNGKEVNAFAAPGGPIYLFKGLVDAMPSDDELAGIIGHEIGHIVKRHTVISIERSLAGQLIFAILFGNQAQVLQNLAFSAIMSGYSRGEEDEADKLGVVHTMRAGYNPYSMLLGMEKLKDLSPDSGGSAGELFADHPNTATRVNNIRNQIANDFKVRPSVADRDKSAQVADSAWNLPPVFLKYAGYKPLLRSYITAGKIYRVSQLKDYSADKFYMSDIENGMAIYYEDSREPIAIITSQDAMGNSMSVSEMASLTLSRIREWINRG